MMSKFNSDEIKKEFPIFKREINGKKLVYLDNAATSQKPNVVINSLVDFYSNHNANVHRGIHTLSEESTDMYEHARENIAEFIEASKSSEIIFTRGATEGINMIAQTIGLAYLNPGDIVLTTNAEHHSNLVPWQIAAERKGATLEFVEVDSDGKIDLKNFKEKLTENKNIKIIAISHASNTLGTIFPVKEIAKLAKEAGAISVIDGSQAVPHLPVNVTSIGCDFYVFSGHKMLGPTGIGVLYGRFELLSEMQPIEFGGGMIDEVTMSKSTWAPLPERLEAGTPNIADAIALSSAVDYLKNIGMDSIREHELEINKYATKVLNEIEGVAILGPKNPEERTGLIAFTIQNVHAHDAASVLNTLGVAVRSGHHCTMPLHKYLDIPASVRASWYLYNSKEDIDVLVEGIKKSKELLS